jgi:hypothetical protein
MITNNKPAPGGRPRLAAQSTTEVDMDTNNNMGGRKVVATVNLQAASFALQDYREMLDKSGDAVNPLVFQELKERFLTAEQEYRSAIHECNCPPNSGLACAACREWSRQQYGDLIPFGGE